MKRELIINAIRNGTVIDHIQSEDTLNVLKILKLKNEQITVGVNLDSKKYGKKGLIKISEKKINITELNKITFVAPNATIIFIKDYEVTKKQKLTVPDLFYDIARCSNERCITNFEPIQTHFITISKEPLKIKCKYCEKNFYNNLIIL